MLYAHSTTKRRTFKHLNAYQRGQIEAMLRLGIPKEALINSAHHLSASFPPCLCRQILHIAFAMRPVCLLDRTKNLHQSDRLHFISDSLGTTSKGRDTA